MSWEAVTLGAEESIVSSIDELSGGQVGSAELDGDGKNMKSLDVDSGNNFFNKLTCLLYTLPLSNRIR